jgi:type I restriction-modification system DNA methylase subunit
MTKTSLKDIEKALWNAGDLERSLLTSSEHKKYILPLLALKRLSDMDADERQGISLPESAKWTTFRNSSFENIGEYLMKAFHDIEHENPDFKGVFSHSDFNSERLGDTYRRNTMWKSIIDVFSQISLKTKDLERI